MLVWLLHWASLPPTCRPSEYYGVEWLWYEFDPTIFFAILSLDTYKVVLSAVRFSNILLLVTVPKKYPMIYPENKYCKRGFIVKWMKCLS